MIMNSKVYDFLKILGRIVLPAISVLYVALAAIWGWPLSEEIAGTIAALVVFLNSILEIASNKYHKEQATADTAIGIGTGEEDDKDADS